MSLRRISTCTARSSIRLGRGTNVPQESTRLTPLFRTQPPLVALRQFSVGIRRFKKTPSTTSDSTSPTSTTSDSASPSSVSDSAEKGSFAGDFSKEEQDAREFDGDIAESKRTAEIREKIVKEHQQKVLKNKFDFGFFEFAGFTMCVFIIIDMLGLDFWDFEDRETKA